MPVWLIMRCLVRSAGGGGVEAKGWSERGERTDAPATAEPFLRVQGAATSVQFELMLLEDIAST
jgi:hypothetical protein